MQGFDNLHIEQALKPIRFRLAIVLYAGGKVDELGGELISRSERADACLPVYGDGSFQASQVFVGRLHTHPAFCADDFIHGGIGRAEAAGQCRQAIVRKAKDCAGRFFDLLESAVMAATDQRGDLRWFVAEEVSCRVDAIDPDIIQGPPAQPLAQTDVAGANLLSEDLRKEPGLT